MPIVPSYGNDNTTVTPQNLPEVNLQAPYRMMQTAGLAGAEQEQTGAKISAAGSAISDQAIQQQAQVNESMVKDQDAIAVSKITGVLQGTTDDKGNFTPGYLQTRGKDAIDGVKGTTDVINGLTDQLSQNLDNPRQQEMFKQVMQSRVESALSSVASHAGTQTTDYAFSSSSNRQNAATQAALSLYNPMPGADNTQYNQQIDTINTELHDQAQLKGLGPAETAEYVREGLSPVFSALVGHLSDNNQTLAAKSFLDAHSDTIDALTQDKLRDQLDQDGKLDKVLSYTDKLTDTTNSLPDQLAQVRTDFENGTLDGKERELVESRLQAQANKNEADTNKQQAQAVGQAQDFFIKHPGASITDLPKPLYRSLEAGGYLASMDSFATRNAGGETIKTNPIVHYNITQNLGTGNDMDIGHMKEADYLTLRSQLSTSDQNAFDAARKSEMTGTQASKDDISNVDLPNFKSALNSRLEGIKVNPAKETDKSYLGAVSQYAQEAVSKDQAIAGRRFNQAEIGNSLDKLFAQDVTFRTSFLGVSTGTGDAKMIGMHINDVPKAARDGITQSLINSGNKTPSDQEILKQYWRLHGQSR